jgi:LPS sulfotransferase NodH
VFGIKLQTNQLFRLTEGKNDKALNILGKFDAVICLSRRDKLGQAISGAKAAASRKWHIDGTDIDASHIQMRPFFSLVATTLQRYLEEEDQMEALARSLNNKVMRLEYEDLVEGGAAAFAKVFEFLGVPFDAKYLDRNGKIKYADRPPSHSSDEFRRQFLNFIQGHPEGAPGLGG